MKRDSSRPGLSRCSLTCADGNMGLQGLHWTSWTPQLASGYGTVYANDCTVTQTLPAF